MVDSLELARGHTEGTVSLAERGHPKGDSVYKGGARVRASPNISAPRWAGLKADAQSLTGTGVGLAGWMVGAC